MANLKTNDKQILEKLFQMDQGYVLNFSNRTFESFFKDNLQIEIYDDKYGFISDSKARRIRAFWTKENDPLVSKSILELIDYIENQIILGKLKKENYPQDLIDKAKQIAGIKPVSDQSVSKPIVTEDEFIKKQIKAISLEALQLDVKVTEVLSPRLEEIRKCLNAKAALAVVFLCGSTLEGILLGVACKYPKQFNTSFSAPQKDGKVLPLPMWTLSSLIDAGKDVGLLGDDVKKHSHALRDFRNYIHPNQQVLSRFNPHEHTAKISWQVLQAAIYEISLFNP